MADITMCAAKKCPEREKCYRFMCKDIDAWQSYADFYIEGKKCSDFVEMSKMCKAGKIQRD